MPEILADVLTLNFLFAIGIVVLGGIMHGYTGWGGGMVMMPLMTLVLSPVEALVMIAVGGILLSAQLLPSAARKANWRDMKAIYLTVLMMTPVGALLLAHVDPSAVRNIIGAMIIVAAIVILSGWQYRGKRNAVAAAAFGSVAGIANGFAAVGSPPFIIYVMAHPESPDVQRANILVGSGIMIVLIVVTLALVSDISVNTVIMGALLAPPHMLGGWLGAKIFQLAPQESFRRVTLILLIILGISVVIL